MKKIILGLLIIFGCTTIFSTNLKAQTIQVLAGNTLNGAMQGVILGGAYMGLNNSTEYQNPMRIGLGLGTLYGIGVAGYDLVNSKGSEFVVSGLFNDGANSSIIVLLDTFYGAATGSVITLAVMLVANEPVLDGLQYGASIGAYIGFGFGVFDTFVLAKRTYEPSPISFAPAQEASGLIGMKMDNGTSFGFVNPTLVQTLDINANSLTQNLNPAVELVNFRVNF